MIPGMKTTGRIIGGGGDERCQIMTTSSEVRSEVVHLGTWIAVRISEWWDVVRGGGDAANKAGIRRNASADCDCRYAMQWVVHRSDLARCVPRLDWRLLMKPFLEERCPRRCCTDIERGKEHGCM